MIRRISLFFVSLFLVVLLFFGIGLAFCPLPGTVPVLMYHFIGTAQEARESKNFVAREGFARQMEILQRLGFRVISMDDFYQIRTGEKKGRGKEIVITFDDGNYTFETEAFPILKSYHFPVTLFVVSESVKRRINGSMPAETLKNLLRSGLIVIGSHSQTHPLLSTLPEEQLKNEVEISKADLEALFGIPINYFAYPSGDLDRRVLGAVEKAGYRLAFTTSHKKLNDIPENGYGLTRIKISDSSDNFFIFWVKISGIFQFFKSERHKLKLQLGLL